MITVTATSVNAMRNFNSMVNNSWYVWREAGSGVPPDVFPGGNAG
jgi:hypothetical protein